MNTLFRFHPRLWISLVAGFAVFFLLPREWSAISRILVAWNCGVALFLGLNPYWLEEVLACWLFFILSGYPRGESPLLRRAHTSGHFDQGA